MKALVNAGLAAAFVAAVTVSPARAQAPVAHLTGTIMCGDVRHAGRYSTVCHNATRYVLLTSVSGAYTIEHQEFSALRDLVGSRVSVIGEINGRRVDILQIAPVAANCRDDE
jgi:hypothetical protein